MRGALWEICQILIMLSVQEFEYKEVKEIQNESENSQKSDFIKSDQPIYATKDDLDKLEKDFKDVKDLLEELFDSRKDGVKNGKQVFGPLRH